MADNDADRKEFDWDLPINVPTIGVHRTLRVTSNESIGAVMIKLASKLGKLYKYVHPYSKKKKKRKTIVS